MDVGKEREQGAEAFPAIGAPETSALAVAGRTYSGLRPSQRPCPNDDLEQTCV
jgi:hypothetical protein